MIVDDLDIVGITVSPEEADAPLVVDPNAVGSGAIALQGFQLVARRDPKVLQLSGAVQVQQLPPSSALD